MVDEQSELILMAVSLLMLKISLAVVLFVCALLLIPFFVLLYGFFLPRLDYKFDENFTGGQYKYSTMSNFT